MRPIAESKGVKLYCPASGRFAFFNSPYPAHILNTGVDIYPGVEFGSVAPSPVDGEVTLIRRVKSPTGKGFEASDHDTVILLVNRDNPETVTKLLHIDPLVELGDRVRVGDPIGVTLRSGYYGWGTSPHIHVEIRNPLDPIRARGGYRIRPLCTLNGEPVDEIVGPVTHIQPEYALIQLEAEASGLIGTVNDEPAVIDGGIPYYGWLGAHISEAPSSGTIELMGQPIGDITESFGYACRATGRNYYFTVKGEKILGLSLTLWPNGRPLVKVIPLKKGCLRLERGEWCRIELRHS